MVTVISEFILFLKLIVLSDFSSEKEMYCKEYHIFAFVIIFPSYTTTCLKFYSRVILPYDPRLPYSCRISKEHPNEYYSFMTTTMWTLFINTIHIFLFLTKLCDILLCRNKADNMYQVCDKHLRVVSVHPLDKNFFLTASTDL